MSTIAPQPGMARPRRVPLGSTNRRLSFELRLRLWLLVLVAPTLILAAWLLCELHVSLTVTSFLVLLLALALLLVITTLTDQVIRPLQTLANVVAALREDDFSFRARGGMRGDSLGDLAIEVNALASTLQVQRSSALEALTLVERVVSSMPSPVLAFDHQSRLRLYNAAAAELFSLTSVSRPNPTGLRADDLNLTPLLAVRDQEMYPIAATTDASGSTEFTGPRFSVRRTSFRLRGEPHTLLVLADVAAALREEERLAWKRLIRVLGHEINNSLTPIKSIAATLRSRLPEIISDSPAECNVARESASKRASELSMIVSGRYSLTTHDLCDLNRGLAVIEDRAASLHRFLEAYRQLSTLPPPRLQSVVLAPLIERIASLETRLKIIVESGPSAMLLADPDQLQQVFINLIQNATDAALEAASTEETPVEIEQPPKVVVAWKTLTAGGAHVVVTITDNGPGLLNPVNLFVPFYTTKPGGSGIGLTLAQQILTAHRGTLTLTNRTDAQGAIAELHLPLDSGSLVESTNTLVDSSVPTKERLE